MQACDTCPNRHLASFFRAVGEEEQARAIEESGCSWWWELRGVDTVTGQESTRRECGARMMPLLMKRFTEEVIASSQTIQSLRSEVLAATQAIPEMIARELVRHAALRMADLGDDQGLRDLRRGLARLQPQTDSPPQTNSGG